MSSNSYEIEAFGPARGQGDTVGRLLAESLRLMSVEVAECHARARQALTGMVIHCRVDREEFDVRVLDQVVRVSEASRAPTLSDLAHLRVRTERSTILALIGNLLTLEQALLTDRLMLRGPVALVQNLCQAMVAYLHGAVRSRSFPALLARLRRLDGGAI